MKLKDAVSRGTGTASAGTYVHQDGTITLYAVLPFDANDGGYAASVLTSNVSAALPYAPVEAHAPVGAFRCAPSDNPFGCISMPFLSFSSIDSLHLHATVVALHTASGKALVAKDVRMQLEHQAV
jgi:hypothetical protein